MNQTLDKAMRVSRSTRPLPRHLKQILAAEEAIGQMTDLEHATLGGQLERAPRDGFLRLWHGLVLAHRQQHAEACEAFLEASSVGCNNWRVGWYLAQSARAAGNMPLVDEACEAVLRANPEFWFARELPKHARGFYAQGDHDKIIDLFFQQHPPRAKVFVEVGAFDGVHYSNVRRLVEQHGWTGVSVEPVAKNFRKLSDSYRGQPVQCVQACASDVEGEVELNVSTYPHLPEWGSDVASISGEDAERWRKQYGAVWTKEKVPARRLTDILEEAGIADVDLISIDAEGHDLEVLRGLDFARFQPQFIVVEYGKQRDAIAAFLSEQGYALQFDNKQDLFMAKPRNADFQSALSPTSGRQRLAETNGSESAHGPQAGSAAIQQTGSLRYDSFAPAERARILAAINCHDCDDVPKVAQAGEVLPGQPPVQIMHNGVKIIEGSYHGAWMTEIIRRLKGHHEPQEEKVFHAALQTLPANAVMIEAGSFWAYYSMWFNKAIAGAQNHLIEPNAEKFHLSQRHFALNEMQGTFTRAFIGAESNPDATFVDWDGRRYPLPQISIDDYLVEHRIPFVHLLHADIQGAELDLLRGCQKAIADGRIGCLFLSTHGNRHAACLEFLKEHNFHVVAEHTIPESAAADGLIVARAKTFAGLESVAITKRSAPIHPSTTETRGKNLSAPEMNAVLSKLNPHLLQLNVLPLAAGVRADTLDPLLLLTPQRFDLVLKHLYARHRALGIDSAWARDLYHQHIRAFSNGTCREGDGRKNCIEDYFHSFDATLDSIGSEGFDPGQTLVPVGRNNVIIDGAHRVAACLFHRQPVHALFFDYCPNEYGAGYFRQRGLDEKFSDAAALEYCRIKTNTFIATVFPSAQGGDAEVRSILNEAGRLVYEKRVTLNRHGALNLVKQIYVGEKWLGDWSNNFGGAAGKTDPCFRQAGPVRVFVFEADSLEAVREAKARIRARFGIENHSVHINDTHEQTLYLGQILLNANSVHFLNHARPRHLERFHHHLALYAEMLAAKRLNPEHFCVDGSAVMAAYGIRDAQDLDFLHFDCDDLETGNRDLSSHNSEIHHHVTTRDDIIFNPDHHFHYFGIKFASLDIVRQLKVKRNEGKDQKDVAAIDRLLGNQPQPRAISLSHPLFTSAEPLSGAAPVDGAPGAAVHLGETRTHEAHFKKRAHAATGPVDTTAIRNGKPQATSAFRFSNDWFATHQPHWDRELKSWASHRGPLNILEIGSYEGRSACWFLTRMMANPKSTLTCVDAWEQRSGERVYEENMEEVFQRFVKNCEATGRDSQVTVHRGPSRAILPALTPASFDLVYVDGDHSTEGVYADTLDAFRLLRTGGLLLWDDYYWAPGVKGGVDKACAELGLSVARLGNNASATKPGPAFTATKPGAKIVALVPARNEGEKIAFCFRALARVADAIVYLDDCSDDETLSIVESLTAECRVERIIRKPQWHRDEPGDRNAMLQAGRKIGGTHFIVIDADEAFTANCAEDEFLRRKILALAPGDQLVLTWIQLWRSVDQYRFDKSIWTNNAKPFVFCDDGQCAYSSEFIHTPRVPGPLKGRIHQISGYTHGLLHFQFVNWRNLLVKQAWYRCLEHIREPQKPIAEINRRYAPSKDETDLGLKSAPAGWFSAYPFFDKAIFDAPDNWREEQILGWFKQYGRAHFQELDIWDVEWGTGTPSPQSSPPGDGERAGVRADQNGDPAQDFIELAQHCFDRGELAPARDHLERALDAAPHRSDLLVALANLEFQLSDPAAAHRHLLRATELQPNDASIHVLLASVSLKLERIQDFEQSIERALIINPDEPGALRLLADLNLQHGSIPDAARNYFKLVQQNEGDIDSLMGLGVCFFKQGDPASARMTFERVLQLQPDHALAKENLGAVESSSRNADLRSAVSPTSSRQHAEGPTGVLPATTQQAGSLRYGRPEVCATADAPPACVLSLSRYHQPPAGSTEQHIDVRPLHTIGAALSSFQALKDYDVRNTGTGLDAAERIFAHILKNKAQTTWTPKSDFWSQTVVVPVECELRSVTSGKFFDELQPAGLDDISPDFAKSEAPRRADIERYVIQLRDGADLGSPAYVTGGLLKKLAPSAAVETNGIYMIDGARRLTASALLHRRTVTVLLVMHEDEYAALLPADALHSLRQRLAALKWFESYQSLPLLGLKGHRSLRRFELMSLSLLRDQVVMDFGCNTGQACLKAVQAGARQVIGVEGMPDTFAGAQEIARLTGLANLRYANVNFNDADFDQQIDATWSEPVDYSFFFSVYRTKELTQRDRLFRYIIQKTRKGIFFEGHAAPKIDTLEYYEWLFESFGLRGKFLGTTEGELRPLFFIDLVASRAGNADLRSAVSPTSSRQSVADTTRVVVPEGQQAGSLRYGRPEVCVTATGTPVVGADSPARTPLVSAIVSTYANERFMEGRLKDLLAQTLGSQLEIIVVDSASRENEGAIVQRFMEQHSNIRYIRTVERETIYQAWNRGIRAARGKYITNANTDDRLRPDALERLAAELDAHPEVALVYADFFITNTENEEFLSHTRTGYSLKPDYSLAIMLDGCHMGPQPMWRRSLHDDIGWFDESLFAAGDYEFWLRVAMKYPMRHVPEFLGLYLHNAAGICNGNTQRTAEETARVQAKYASQFPPAAKNLPRGFFHRAAVQPGGFVNIGMVTYNRLDFTKRAITALVEKTDFPHVLTVIDNASTDGTRQYLTGLKQLGVIKNLILLEENVGIAKASNLAWAQEPDAEFYLKLDNDIVIQKPGWLTRMVEVTRRVPQIGVLAYNFEPSSYPLKTINGCVVRVKQRGNLGGACLLVPKRTERELGCWCEDYGLYGEEDADYAERVRLSGKLLAYMDDEDVGLHLPAGKAATIDQETYVAADGVEEKQHQEYREWKDQLRKKNAQAGGAYHQNVIAYHNKTKLLRCESEFVKKFEPDRAISASVAAAVAPAITGLVSIVIPVFNRLDMTRPCIEAIHRETRPGMFEIIVVDNASTDGTKEYLEAEQTAGRLRTIRNRENFGFAKAINQGLQAARGEFWLMLNNDTVALPGWLDAMLSELASNQKIGAVGSCLLYPGGELIQHSGVAIGAGQGLLHPYHKDRLRRLDRVPQARQSRDCQAVTGACLLVRRTVIEQVGMLDEGYVNGFEDVDFCFRIITAGWRIRYCAESRVIHHESMTPGRKKNEEANYRRMNAAWKARITPDESAEETKRGIQDVLCREKLAQEPGHRRAMELLRDLAKGRGESAEAAEWSEQLAARNADLRSAVSPTSSRQSVADTTHVVVVEGQQAASLRYGRPEVCVTGAGRPSVSIIIPTFNNLALTKQCLAALYKTTTSSLAEILIVDNGSVDGTVAFLQAEEAAGRLSTVLNATNLGFARGCNQGALAARGNFVLFLNNDTEATPGWLEAMLSSARQPQVGIVGCKLLYPDGSIQHAGIEWIKGVPDHRFRNASADAPEVNERREFDMVTGACFLMPRAIFLELGGFDEVYRNGVEDVDLCLRARVAGHKVVYEPTAVVYHHEGKSQGRFNHVSENLKLFFARWNGQFDPGFKLIVPQKARVQKSAQGLLVTPVNVSWDGSFLDLGSLSLVNRELTHALGSQPLVNLTCLGKNAVPKPLSSMPVFQDTARRLRAQPAQPAQVTVRHAWPPNWERPASGAWVLIQPWEFGTLPAEWLPHLQRVDEIWAPSDYVRRVYVDSGVDARKVHVVPNGIHPQQFNPDAKPMTLATKRKFKFLFVGGTIQRKGPDLLLKAYLENFTAQDDVCLVIKDFGGQSVYAGQTFEAQIKAAQATPNAPEILYLNSELPPEDLPGLYTACDCLVHPYRGEGFGLPVLEAMACGLPVVVTAGGSTDDFATDDLAYRVPSIRREFGASVSGMKLVKPGWMLEPDLAALGERMHWIVTNQNEARAKGRAASDHVRREWTWDRAAAIATQRLVELGYRKPVSTPAASGPFKAKAKPIALPACAKLGHLGEARELLRERKLEAAWKSTVAALSVRPFHPEAFLLLAEIAQTSGASKLAKELAQRARQMAPKWKPAQQSAKASAGKTPVAIELPSLPGYLSLTSRAPRLTVCLIAKNEERFIGQCLESVRDLAQQIIVVDTGSTDATRDIAARFGAEIASFDWCDDFSAARNVALEHATGDWILFLDADEELPADQREKLRKLLKDPAALAFRLPMIDQGREEEGVSHVPRLFRNAPGLFYVGRIHEQVFSSIEVRRAEWGLENKFGDATLLHHGYTKEMVQSRDKIARNLKLLEQAIEEMPGEPNLLMNLGLEMIRDGRPQEGLDQYGAAFTALSALPKNQVTPELRESLLTQYCTHLLTAKNFAEVARVLQSPLAKSAGLTASMHWLFGLACIESKLYPEGAEQMRQCVAKRGQRSVTPVNRNILKGGPSHCLALCLAALKQRDDANKAFLAALKDDPNARPVRFDYARFLAEVGSEVEALKWLHQLMAEDSSELRVWQFGGLVALSKPEFLEFACDWTSEAIKLHPQNAAILEQRATALLLSGKADEALPLWKQLGATTNPKHCAAVVICDALLNHPLPSTPKDLAVRVNQEFVAWYRRLLAVNAARAIQTLNQHTESLRQVVPDAVRILEVALAEANSAR